MNDAQPSTATVIATCRQERQNYQQTKADGSPACVELLRRAFAQDQEAWRALEEVFKPLMNKWIGVQSYIEPEDILQDAFIEFYRYAPRVTDLTATNDLSFALAYLRKCVKTALLTKIRQTAKHQKVLSLNRDIPTAQDEIGQLELRLALEQLLETEQEQLVFHLRFVCNIGPQSIFEDHSDQFKDYEEVATIIQRLTRRFRGNKGLQEWGSARQKMAKSALLEMRVLKDADKMEIPLEKDMKNQCVYGEEILLDYLTGLASPELQQAIEHSPACLRAVQALAQEIGPWLANLQRVACPGVEQLIAYQQKQLKGPVQLVLYNHIQRCPRCQQELAILEAMDAIPLEAPPSPLRQLIEALLRPSLALPMPVRGEVLVYHTPQVYINLSTRKNRSKARTWTLHGQLRTLNGEIITTVERIFLGNLEDTAIPEQFGLLDDQGFFVFKDLAAGHYRLRLLTAEEEIVIRTLEIGDHR